MDAERQFFSSRLVLPCAANCPGARTAQSNGCCGVDLDAVLPLLHHPPSHVVVVTTAPRPGAPATTSRPSPSTSALYGNVLTVEPYDKTYGQYDDVLDTLAAVLVERLAVDRVRPVAEVLRGLGLGLAGTGPALSASPVMQALRTQRDKLRVGSQGGQHLQQLHHIQQLQALGAGMGHGVSRPRSTSEGSGFVYGSSSPGGQHGGECSGPSSADRIVTSAGGAPGHGHRHGAGAASRARRQLSYGGVAGEGSDGSGGGSGGGSHGGSPNRAAPQYVGAAAQQQHFQQQHYQHQQQLYLQHAAAFQQQAAQQQHALDQPSGQRGSRRSLQQLLPPPLLPPIPEQPLLEQHQSPRHGAPSTSPRPIPSPRHHNLFSPGPSERALGTDFLPPRSLSGPPPNSSPPAPSCPMSPSSVPSPRARRSSMPAASASASGISFTELHSHAQQAAGSISAPGSALSNSALSSSAPSSAVASLASPRTRRQQQHSESHRERAVAPERTSPPAVFGFRRKMSQSAAARALASIGVSPDRLADAAAALDEATSGGGAAAAGAFVACAATAVTGVFATGAPTDRTSPSSPSSGVSSPSAGFTASLLGSFFSGTTASSSSKSLASELHFRPRSFPAAACPSPVVSRRKSDTCVHEGAVAAEEGSGAAVAAAGDGSSHDQHHHSAAGVLCARARSSTPASASGDKRSSSPITVAASAAVARAAAATSRLFHRLIRGSRKHCSPDVSTPVTAAATPSGSSPARSAAAAPGSAARSEAEVAYRESLTGTVVDRKHAALLEPSLTLGSAPPAPPASPAVDDVPFSGFPIAAAAAGVAAVQGAPSKAAPVSAPGYSASSLTRLLAAAAEADVALLPQACAAAAPPAPGAAACGLPVQEHSPVGRPCTSSDRPQPPAPHTQSLRTFPCASAPHPAPWPLALALAADAETARAQVFVGDAAVLLAAAQEAERREAEAAQLHEQGRLAWRARGVLDIDLQLAGEALRAASRIGELRLRYRKLQKAAHALQQQQQQQQPGPLAQPHAHAHQLGGAGGAAAAAALHSPSAAARVQARMDEVLAGATPLFDAASAAASGISHPVLAGLVREALWRYMDPRRGRPKEALRDILQLADTATAAADGAAGSGSGDGGDGEDDGRGFGSSINVVDSLGVVELGVRSRSGSEAGGVVVEGSLAAAT